MRFLFSSIIILVLSLSQAHAKEVFMPSNVNIISSHKFFEHGGGLARDGCHWDRKKRTRHCH